MEALDFLNLPVQALLRAEIRGRAVLGHPSVIQHQHLVRLGQGGDPVGDQDNGGGAETLFKRSLERVKSTNSHARKQVDDVAREFGLTGAERKEFGKYIEELKEDVDHMSGAQNY